MQVAGSGWKASRKLTDPTRGEVSWSHHEKWSGNKNGCERKPIGKEKRPGKKSGRERIVVGKYKQKRRPGRISDRDGSEKLINHGLPAPVTNPCFHTSLYWLIWQFFRMYRRKLSMAGLIFFSMRHMSQVFRETGFPSFMNRGVLTSLASSSVTGGRKQIA